MAVLLDPFFRKLGAVANLSFVERGQVAALCDDIRSIPRRRHLVEEGERPEHVHIVLEGWAGRYNVVRDGGRRITALLLPGDFCDLRVTVLAELDHSILALSDCQVAFVPASKIGELMRSTTAVVEALWRSTLIDESILRRWLVAGGRLSASQQIAHLLLEIFHRLESVGLATADAVDFPIGQEEIADSTGLTSVHVNRMLREL